MAFATVPYAGFAAAPLAYAQAPLAYAQAPLVKAAPAPVLAAAPIPYAPSSQFQAQDEFGNINYGYSNINSQKHEIGNAYGGVTGGYSYTDANGELQTVNYIADALGFRVQATNLPVAPDAIKATPLKAPIFDLEAPVFDGVAPVAVEKTAEVKAAEAAFFEKFEEAKNRQRRDAQFIASPYGGYGAYPYASNYAYGAYPYAYAPQVATTFKTLEPIVANTPAATIKTVPVEKTVVSAPALTYAAAPAPVTYAAAAPVAYSAPLAYAAPVPAAAGVDATLETVKLNPGHAVAYRVY